MPVLLPAELWKRSGRYGIDELFKLHDRKNADLVLAMTHEEVVTLHVAQSVRSYRDLPLILYHIQTKERDEPRPRAGVLRTREFVMKDAYMFDRDLEGLDPDGQGLALQRSRAVEHGRRAYDVPPVAGRTTGAPGHGAPAHSSVVVARARIAAVATAVTAVTATRAANPAIAIVLGPARRNHLDSMTTRPPPAVRLAGGGRGRHRRDGRCTGTYPDRDAADRGCPVRASKCYIRGRRLRRTLCGREAGEIPAQSRYGERPRRERESGRRPHGACSNLREKGRQVPCALPDRPLVRAVRIEGSRNSSRPLRPPTGGSRLLPARPRPASSGGSLLALVRRSRPVPLPRAPRSSPSPSAAAALPTPPRPPPSYRRRPPARSPAPAFPVTLTDDEGTALTLAAEPQKSCRSPRPRPRSLFALGVGDSVVGRTDFNDYPAEALAVPAVATLHASMSNRSSISTPDLVLAGGMGSPRPSDRPVARARHPGPRALRRRRRRCAGRHRAGRAAVGASTPANDDDRHDAGRASTRSTPPRPRPRQPADLLRDRLHDATGRSTRAPTIPSCADMVTLAGGRSDHDRRPGRLPDPARAARAADPQVIVLGDDAFYVPTPTRS